MATKRKARGSIIVNLHLPFIIYIRVSRIGGRSASDGYISKIIQREECEALAAREGVSVYAVFKEENLSGTSLKRPKFQEALQLIRDGVCGGILVMTLDRFSRDTADGLAVIKDIEKHGGSVLCGDGVASCRTADLEMTTTARLMVATREVGGKREGFAKTVELSLKGGRHLGIPYGYMRGTWKNRDRVLVAHPDEAPVVERIFQLRKAGHGTNGIAKMLNDEGILPRTFRRALKDDEGDRTDEWEVVQGRWRGKTIRSIIRSETYLGRAWNGEHEYPNAHQPLVSKQLWRDANAVKTTKPVRTGEDYLLSGMLRCANCGYAMAHTSRSNGAGGRRRYYVCRSQNAQPCPHPTSVPAPALEQLMDDTLMAAAAQLKTLRPVQDDGEIALTEQALRDAEAEYAAALDRQDKAQASGVRGAQLRVIERNHDEKLAALNAAEHAHDRTRQASRGLVLPISVAQLLRTYPSMPVVERRHLLSLMFACAVVRPARAYGEDIAERVVIVPAGAVVGNIFEFVVNLNPARAGVLAG